jgi:hypothetical protein
VEQVLLQGVLRGQQGREKGAEHHDAHHHQPDHRQLVAEKALSYVAELGLLADAERAGLGFDATEGAGVDQLDLADDRSRALHRGRRLEVAFVDVLGDAHERRIRGSRYA